VKKLIKRVLATKELYERMGLEKTATPEEIKKKFRKLSLLLHPDKCALPGAEESFKAINQAYTILSDPDKKKNYDLCGEETPQPQPTYYRADSEIHDEIIRMFFNMNRNSQRSSNFRYYTFNTSGAQTHGPGANFTFRRANDVQPTYLYFLLLAMFLLFALSSNLFSDPPFTYEKQGEFVVQRSTLLNIPYYTKPSYEQKYSATKRYELEDSIDRQHLMFLFDDCRYEKQRVWQNSNSKPESCMKYEKLEKLYEKKAQTK